MDNIDRDKWREAFGRLRKRLREAWKLSREKCEELAAYKEGLLPC
jgi:hypothetical protein